MKKNIIDLYRLNKEQQDSIDIHDFIFGLFETIDNIKQISSDIGIYKSQFLKIIKKHNGNRELRPEKICNKNIISIFDSTLTRVCDLESNLAYNDLIVVRLYYFDILDNIINNGFTYNGARYIYFSSSAGQIRTKKAVFIKEKLFLQHQNTITCGLTVDKINLYGGVNRNKYLAYLSLCNSATDAWEDFNIDKCIVVDDFETIVNGIVDFIDDKDYSIIRKQMDVPITHSDGCGIILPSLKHRNFMIRAPWVKGLLTPFDFIRFIKEFGGNPIITDIYGKEHNVIDKEIEIIFTKSQFKMWKYYKDWDEYKNNFKEYNCQVGICNEEVEFPRTAKINYQMLQTLSDITDEEINKICKMTNYKIKNIASDKSTMLKVFGVTENNNQKTNLQKALFIYPELLSDVYTKDVLRLIKNKIVKEARSGRLFINGKYQFIIPDMFAFCEWLFLKNDNPNGLLANGEVFSSVYKKSDKLDCLRSPHLYIEHAVRHNAYSKDIEKWFNTNGLYVSHHDLISKVLQFDNDGDMALVVADETTIDVAERNTKNIVPLYYVMRKADAQIINNKILYEGLISAFTCGNIGESSNLISKIWDSEIIDLELIKILTAHTNYTIDSAKTLYKPNVPDDIKTKIKKFSKRKLPHFFIYAKNLSDDRVESFNNRTVNRLKNFITDSRMAFTAKNCGKFNYKMLMQNKDIEINDDNPVIAKYKEINSKMNYRLGSSIGDADKINNVYTDIREKLLNTNKNVYYIVDVLIKYLYLIKKSKYKDTLWNALGDIIVENLNLNLSNGTVLCNNCGKRFYSELNGNYYCESCSVKFKNVIMVECVECGKEFIVSKKNRNKERCDACYKEYRRNQIRENVTLHRQNNNHKL